MTTTLVAVLAGVALAAIAAFAVYRGRQRARTRRIEAWVTDYLFLNSKVDPKNLSINCSDDSSWPVLVEFGDSRTGVRHNLQFACAGPISTFRLVSKAQLDQKNQLS